MTYEILDGISRADIAFRVRGKDLDEIFIAGAHALFSIMMQNIETVLPMKSITFSCEASDLEMLYFDFLSEFIYRKDSERLILLPKRVRIRGSENSYTCECSAMGETLDRKRHLFAVDIKAITMHRLSIERHNDEWTATVVVDV
ncbi:MAG: archease [Spirochaetes bacterium]|nr:archease [Spirochaetota bacterium]